MCIEQDVSVDTESNSLMFFQNKIELPSLSKSEIMVLALLIDRYPNACSREELMDIGWPGKIVTEVSVNVAISNIRTALGAQGISELIQTERGVGYIATIPKGKINPHEKISLEDEIAPPLAPSNENQKPIHNYKLKITIFMSIILFSCIFSLITFYIRVAMS